MKQKSDSTLDHRRAIILIVFVLSQLIVSIAGYSWGPLAPFLKSTMSLSGTQIGSISSTFYFAAALSALPAGAVVDRFGVRSGILLWLGLTGVPLFFLGLAHGYYAILLIIIAVAGIGYGMGNPVASKGLFIWFDQRTRGTVFGLRQSAVTVGGGVAGILLVFLSKRLGPFAAMQVVGLMIMAMIVFASCLYQNPRAARDNGKNLLLKDSRSLTSGFKGLFSNKALLAVSVVMAMLGLAQGIIVTFLLLYINEMLDYSLIAAGSLFGIVMISGAVGRIFWGVVSDRLFNGSRKPVLITICGLAALSITILAFCNKTWPRWFLLPIIVAIGLSTLGWNGIAMVLVTEVSSGTKTATSIGFASTIGWSGLFLGPVVFGNMTDSLGYFYAWAFLGVLCLFSVIFCFFLPGLEQRPLESLSRQHPRGR
ncbi:MAG: hypothetical protein B1H13_00315 [Desulfobacteraceae bacterium 4484_190.3]|nr:MAG: hypothetical protein B1H13_00315 [Desulfobacteraceae bacterium 4484_190.3]